jgi:hypothetical protein
MMGAGVPPRSSLRLLTTDAQATGELTATLIQVAISGSLAYKIGAQIT